MGGGLLQLVAYGAQDIYLTGNPQITFFKIVYRRHTNFSMECVKQAISGTINPSDHTTNGTVVISRSGDLLSQVYVKTSQDKTMGINGDNILNVLDIVLMINMVLNNEYTVIADVNEDGLVNILDIIIYKNIILGL